MQKIDAKEINDNIKVFFSFADMFQQECPTPTCLSPTGNSEGKLRKSLYHRRLLAGC